MALKPADVTIIIPVYCTTEESLLWLLECLESARQQGCRVVVVDDKSPLQNKIDKILRNYEISKYILQHMHKGVSVARNVAVKHATTDLIYPLDCDDILKPGAIATLLKFWRGAPLYSDLEFFGDRNIPHYNLKDFSCRNLAGNVAIASVNVLHSKRQWEAVGGWDERILLYEDGEYNARLLGEFCGIRVPQPLVRYRQHKSQRSQSDTGGEVSRQMADIVRRTVMARRCCGGGGGGDTPEVKMQNGNAPQFYSQEALNQSTSLPGSGDGLVRARYVGNEGAGQHYYAGRATKFKYKVVYGAEIMADPRDVVESNPSTVNGLLLALEPLNRQPVENQAANAPTFFRQAAEQSEEVAAEIPVKTSKKRVLLEEDMTDDTTTGSQQLDKLLEEASGSNLVPVEDKETGQVYGVPDVASMSLQELRDADLTEWDATQMLKLEKEGKGRKKHIAFLQRVISKSDHEDDDSD